WSDDALAYAIQAVARADAEVKGASRDPVHAVERAVLAICNARHGRIPRPRH
ncbi:MAG: DNA polymerase III, delta subunit, partial [Actinomyces urogenitalis DORA_12]